MTDIDEEAVKAAKRNMEINKTSKTVAKCLNLLDGENVSSDILLANIMAEILIEFSQGIKKNVKKGGKIILSGILLEKENVVLSAYKKEGFKLLSEIKKGEWCALAMENAG